MNTNYLKNSYLLEQIEKSKLSYCAYDDPSAVSYDIAIESDLWALVAQGKDATTQIKPDVTYRIIDNRPQPNNYVMRPFVHARNGKIILRSHQKDGQLTNGLGHSFIKLTDRYGSRYNWQGYSYLSELKSSAIVQLCRTALRFNEAKSNNPFAYFTQITKMTFIQQLNAEKKHAHLRDILMQDQGFDPNWLED